MSELQLRASCAPSCAPVFFCSKICFAENSCDCSEQPVCLHACMPLSSCELLSCEGCVCVGLVLRLEHDALKVVCQLVCQLMCRLCAGLCAVMCGMDCDCLCVHPVFCRVALFVFVLLSCDVAHLRCCCCVVVLPLVLPPRSSQGVLK